MKLRPASWPVSRLVRLLREGIQHHEKCQFPEITRAVKETCQVKEAARQEAIMAVEITEEVKFYNYKFVVEKKASFRRCLLFLKNN